MTVETMKRNAGLVMQVHDLQVGVGDLLTDAQR